jgi:hypothetical protein
MVGLSKLSGARSYGSESVNCEALLNCEEDLAKDSEDRYSNSNLVDTLNYISQFK